MNKLRNITLHGLFNDIIRCFIMSCGTTLIINFFYDIGDITKTLIRSEVTSIFALLLILNIIYRLFIEKKAVLQPSISYGIASIKEEFTSKKNELLAEYNLNISTIHEAGHALMSYLKKIESFNVNVSYTSSKVVSIYKNWSAEDVKNRILIVYAGAIAEELVLGEFHYGCIGFDFENEKDGDFLKATDLIKSYIIMTDTSKSKSLLESELSNDIVILSKEFYEEAKNIILEHKYQLDEIVKALKKDKYLTKEKIEELLIHAK